MQHPHSAATRLAGTMDAQYKRIADIREGITNISFSVELKNNQFENVENSWQHSEDSQMVSTVVCSYHRTTQTSNKKLTLSVLVLIHKHGIHDIHVLQSTYLTCLLRNQYLQWD